MSSSALAASLRHLRGKLAAQQHNDDSDEQLLHAFLMCRDDSAFAVLVRRHGPMVLHVCRRVLGHEQDAEDAFQATFLFLARRAANLRNKASLASWLHGIAYRIALKAKRTAARRRKHERQTPPRPNTEPSTALLWDEVRILLDDEIARLPEKYRSVFVLHYLEDCSREETARRLGLKEGTVASRLAEARKRLQLRLARHGVELSAVLAASALAAPPTSALPAKLIVATIEAALATAAGDGLTGIVPATVAELFQSTTTATMVSKSKIAAVVLLIVATSGSLVILYGRVSGPLAVTPQPPAAKAQEKLRPYTLEQRKKESVEVSGMVLDPDGKPVTGAKVVLQQRRPNPELPDFFPVPTTGTTDAGGRFRFSANVHLNSPVRRYSPMLTLTAHVPGYGPAALATTSPDELNDRTLRLVKDDVPIRGRILNLEGRPIAGVTVRPITVIATAANDLGRLIKAIETNVNIWTDLPEDYRPNIVFSTSGAGLMQTTKTDREGKFSLSGFGRERIVVLRLEGPTIETCILNAMTRMGPTVRANRPRPDYSGGGLKPPKPLHEPPATFVYAHGNPFDFAPGPALVLEGTLRDQDTGKPIAGVAVRHGIGHDFGSNFGWAQEELTTTTDADGNYRLAGLSRTSSRIQFIPHSQPYLPAAFSPPAPAFGEPAKLDVRLKRGVWIRGRVTDKATGLPVQAVVQYFAFADNPDLRGVKGFAISQVVSSKGDGSFVLAALRGRGIVAVKTDDMRWGTYLCGQGAVAISGPRYAQIDSFATRPHICTDFRFNTLVGIEPDAKAESVTCNVQLDPGKTVQGTILDPEGKPLAGAGIRGLSCSLVELRDLPSAKFAIPAVNPRKPQAYFFEHRKRNLAAAVILKGDEPPDFRVKLKPTATLTGRLVTERGDPLRNYFIEGRLEAGQLKMTRVSRGFFSSRTDAKGRFRFEGLLAGVKLGASARSDLFANLTLQAGEVRNLGDIKIKEVSETRP